MANVIKNVRKDIDTSNPRELMRFIRNTLRDIGYKIKDDTVNITKDDVGEVGLVTGKLIGKKHVREVKSFSVPLLSLGIKILLAAISVGLIFLSIFLSTPLRLTVLFTGVAVGGVLFFFWSEKKSIDKEVDWKSKIEVHPEGEVYAGKRKEERERSGDKEETESKIVASLTVSMKAFAPTGEAGYKNEQEKKLVNQYIEDKGPKYHTRNVEALDKIVNRLESFEKF